MSIVGEATGVFGLIEKGWRWLRDRMDPARAQAQRLIQAFEAYGIARQQIARLLPDELKLPNAAFSTPDKLKDKVTPELLDWAAEHLALRRAWFDGVAYIPQLIVDHYKSPAGYQTWLANSVAVGPDVMARFLYVWKPKGQEIWPDGDGPLCFIYEECSDGLDATEFSRYWLLSDEWGLEHAPCIENMITVVAVARSLGIMVLGRDFPLEMLYQMEAGKAFIPKVSAQARCVWYPEDLIDPIPGEDTEWNRARWKGAQAYLAKDGVTIPLPS